MKLTKLLGAFLSFSLISTIGYSSELPVISYIPKTSVSNHKTHYKCSVNRVEKQRIRNKIARKSRKNNW